MRERHTLSELVGKNFRRSLKQAKFDIYQLIRQIAPPPPALQAIREDAKRKGASEVTMAQINREWLPSGRCFRCKADIAVTPELPGNKAKLSQLGYKTTTAKLINAPQRPELPAAGADPESAPGPKGTKVWSFCDSAPDSK